MKKVLSLVLVLSIVLGSFGFAFAAPAAQVHAGDVLKGLGVLTGVNAAGDLDLDGPLNRQDMIVLLSRLLGAEDTAKSFGLKPSFTDVTVAFYVPYIAWAEANGYTNGIGGGKFGYGQDLTVQETLTLMMRALGYTPEWNAVPALAVELGLVENTNGMSSAASRGKMAELTLQALLTPMNGEEVTLGTFLGYEGFELEEEVVVPEELEVVSVSATNLKEIVVVFNQEVDEATVVNANFVVKKGTVTVVTTATLQADGKTVVLAVTASGASLDNQANYTVEVKDVKDLAGEKIETVTVAFKAFDATLPEVLEIRVTGPRQFELIFSEPIKAGSGTVTVKDGNTSLAVNPTFTFNDTNVVEVHLYSNMVDGKTYDVNITSFKDFADYNNVVTIIQLPYVKDESAPIATVEKVEQGYVVVNFNKPVTGITAGHFYHTFTAWTAVGVYSDAAMEVAVNPSLAYSKVYVQFYDATATGAAANLNRPLPEGNVSFYIRPTAGGNTIRDRWTNAYGEQAFALVVAADRVAPEVTSIEVVSERSFKVKFNKEVQLATSNVEVLAEDGKVITGINLSLDKTVGKEFIVNFGKDLPGDTILINIKNVEDTTLLKNKLVLYSTLLLIEDKTAPEVTRVDFRQTGSGDNIVRELFVVFNEAVDSETALVASNYFIADTPYTRLTGTPTFYSGNTIVRIPLTAAQATGIVGKDLFVTGVKDLNGNVIAPDLTEITTIATNRPAAFTTNQAVRATDAKTIVVPFTQFVTGLTEAHVTVTVNSVVQQVASLSISTNASGNTVATIGLVNDLPYDAALVNVAIAADAVENEFGITNLAISEVVYDKIAPVVHEIQYINASTIRVYFKEDLNPLTLAAAGTNGFSVAGGTLTTALIDGSNAKLVVLSGSNFTVNTDVLYNGTNGITDVNNNSLKQFNHTAALKVDEAQAAVNTEAGGVAATLTANDAVGTQVLPSVAAGYTIAVKTTSDATKYDLDGKIVAAGTSTVVYTVTHTASGVTADTVPVTVTVTIP